MRIHGIDWIFWGFLLIMFIAGLWFVIFPNQWWDYFARWEKKGIDFPDFGTGRWELFHSIAKSKNRHWYSICWGIGMMIFVIFTIWLGFSEGGRWHGVVHGPFK